MISNKEDNFISLVFYVHNDAAYIASTLEGVCAAMEADFAHYEVICVDDASSDDSIGEIRRFSARQSDAPISIVNMSSYQGTELSMSAGLDLAIGDFVYEFDTVYVDYPFSLIRDIYFKALEGYDIVSVCPRNVEGKFSKSFYKLYNSYNVSSQVIRQERFRILSRRAINRVKSLNQALVYRKAVYANCGLERTFVVYENKKGKRKYDASEKKNRRELGINSLILFTNIIQRLSLYVSLFFLLITILVGGYTILSHMGLLNHARKPVEGWTSVMLFLSLGFFGVFLFLTILLQYLSVILNLIFKKKKYLVDSVEKITNN